MKIIFRIAIVLTIFTTFFNAIAIICVGVYKTIHAITILVTEGTAGKPGLELFHSLDNFLIAMVFLIMSFGFGKLFYPEFAPLKSIDLPWLKIDDFFQLKTLLWNTILLTLLVSFGISAVKSEGHWEWTSLVVPIAVLLFSLSIKFIKH